MPNPLPFHQTAEACELFGVELHTLEVEGGVVGVQLLQTRAFPGARLAQVPRFGRGIPVEVIPALVRKLCDFADGANLVAVRVETYAEQPDQREALAVALAESGFSRSTESRSYSHTLWMDLAPSEDDLLMSFHRSARRNVRLPERKGYLVEALGPGDSAANLAELFEESFRSTGGEIPQVDWDAWLALSATAPDRVRIVGIREEGSADVQGFAAGIRHGDVVEYHHAASTRRRQSGVPLLYAPVWELMRWGKSAGARWFDFGGVTVDDPDSDDPLQGISDFKRFFCRNLVEVGGEWVREAPSMAGTLWRTAKWIQGITRRGG